MRTRSFKSDYPNFGVLAAAALLPLMALTAAAGDTPVTEAPWFEPSLTTQNDPICGAFLSGAKRHSSDYGGLKAVEPFFSGQDRGNSSVQDVPGSPELLTFIRKDKKPLYVEHIRNPGCGGACESESLGLYLNAPNDKEQTDAVDTTPASESWTIYETASARQFVAGIVDHQLEVYSASPTAQWKLSCRVQLEPDLDHTNDPRVQKAATSLQALGSAVEAMALGEGYGMCGTMHTDGRWAQDFKHALTQVLFDPTGTAIALQASENSYGDYSRIYAALAEWSLGGRYEYRALQRYDSQLRETTATVQDFYQSAFHWPREKALEAAKRSITGAVSHRFGFYMYNPYSVPGEAELRQAILTHQPMGAVKAITVGSKALDASNNDSILDIAVEYPEALSYLLARGSDPNSANGFGKTPLMYATQYNQADAVRILLQAGADPNATTTAAPENCAYAIKEHNVTPLHYAVRYADRKVVEALLRGGAVPYIKTQGYIDPAQGNYPIDRLHEEHANLSSADVKALEVPLQIPSEPTRAKLSTALTLKAESANVSGRSVEAYRAISLAKFADPTNTRAVADFPILALKSGAVAAALEGSADAFAIAKTPADQAAAVFNEGLACEAVSYLRPDNGFNYFGSLKFCPNGYIDSFVRAWKLQPTASRVAALVQRLGPGEPSNCSVKGAAGDTATYRIFAMFGSQYPAGQYERLYALYPPSTPIDPSTIQWKAANASPPATKPRVVETLALDPEHALVILEGEYFATSIVINGTTCQLINSSSPKPTHTK